MKALFKGALPINEGYELGQYHGPPIVNAEMLKGLAGMDPKDKGIPGVNLSLVSKKLAGEASANLYKETTLTAPNGKMKVIHTLFSS